MVYKKSIKLLSIVYISLLTTNVFAQNTTAYFVTYPEINENVEAFTNAFVKSLLPEIQQSEVKFDFSLENGVRRTDLAYGQIAGNFTGFAVVPDSNQQSAIDMDFRFYFEILNPPNRPQKYGMNFKADGVIENSAAFADFFLGVLIPKCQEHSSTTMNQILKNACQALTVSTSDANKSDVQMGYDLLTAWKLELLSGLNTLDDRNFNPIKNDFIKYIDQRIQISNVNNQLNLSINMADLAFTFDGVGRNFLLQTELIDYSIQTLSVQMNSEKIGFSVHVQKLHSVSSINNLISAATAFSNVIQDPIKGTAIAEAIRQGSAVTSALQDNASTLDNLSAAATGVWGRVFGSPNDDAPATTERQEELGLD